MDVYDKTPEELARALETDLVFGLSELEAQNKLHVHGANTLPKLKPPHSVLLFLKQWKNPLILLLSLAALVAVFLGEFVEGAVISAILFLDCSVGFYHEYQAEENFGSLRSFLTPKARVVRSGHASQISARELVPGDLVLLEEGDHVPADGRLVTGEHLSVNEAPLTGKSSAVHKTEKALFGTHLRIEERRNTLFLGTTILSGKAKLLVTTTGIETELGKIAHMLEQREEKTPPLEKKLLILSYKLGALFLGIISLLFLFGIAQGQPWVDLFLLLVNLAVASVPEGLPIVITISLGIGMRQIFTKSGLVRRLSSMETLGSATHLCLGKTGTLTKNELKATEIWAGGEHAEMERVLKGDFLEVLKIGVLCNTAVLLESGETRGDLLEGALLHAAARQGLFKEALEEKEPLLREFPFDLERKRMSMLRGETLYVKGAPDKILGLSTTYWKEGKQLPLEETTRREIETGYKTFLKEGLEVLAFAWGKSSCEENLCFAGYIGFFDAPREEVAGVLKSCKEASIRVAMLTGDRKEATRKLAEQVGWDTTEVVEGSEISASSDERLEETLSRASLFARVSAEDKLRVIKTLQERKEAVVAMVGDGINDAPAIHQADIGIAMGMEGTEATRQSADMVLLENRFSALVLAIEEGRRLYQNFVRLVFYLLSANISEMLVLFFGALVQFATPDDSFHPPLLAIQILWINLVANGLPGIALSFDPKEENTMQTAPLAKDTPLLSLKQLLHLIAVAIVTAVGTLVCLRTGFYESEIKGQTMAFTGLVFIQLLLVWVVRWPLKLHENSKLAITVFSVLFFHAFILYLPPLEEIFGTVPLSIEDWQVLIGVGLGCLGLFSLLKKLFSRL